MSFYTKNKECYIFSVPSGYVKVGISDNIDRRIKEIQAYCYEPVKFEMGSMRSDASPVSAAMLEYLVHLKLKPFEGERREWFRGSVDIALDVWITTYWFLAIPPGHKDITRVHPRFSGQASPKTEHHKGLVDVGM